MAKIPQSLASGEIPGSVPQAQPRVGYWTAPAQAVGELGQEIEVSGRKWQAIEERLQSSREAVYQSQVMSRLDAFQADYLSKVDDTKSGKVVAEEWTAAANQFLTGELQGADERVRNSVQARAMLHVADGANRARGLANAKVIEGTQNAALLQLKDLEGKGTPEALREGQDLLRGLTEAGVFSAEVGNAREELLRKGTISNAFVRDMRVGLSGAFDKVNRREGLYADITDVEQERFLGSIRAEAERQEAKARQDMKDREHAEAQREKQIKRESDDAHLEAMQSAVKGTYSLDRLDQEARAYRWTPAEYEHLRELMVNPKAQKSDPDTLEQAMLRARSVSVTQRDRDQFATWYKGKRLSAEDYARVDNEAQQNIRATTDESKSNLSRYHTQAEQELRAGLGITGLLETLTQDQRKAYSAALQELTERSSFMRGKEDPLAVVRDLVPRYQSIITDNARLTVEQKTKLLRFKTPQELEAAKGQISPEQYRIERQRLIDIGAYIPAFLRVNEPPETTTTPPKPKLQREKK